MSVLITGGAGSLGRELVRLLLSLPEVRRLVIFSRDEAKHHDMRTAGFTDERLRYFIGDVRDRDRLMLAFRGVDLIVHAAALKQVPAGETDPLEFVQTNIGGAANVILAALHCGVQRVIGLSTDKCAQPLNLYGATKLVAEKLFVQANSYRGESGTRFACVRYGNVINSRGSVIPLWREQAKAGRITVTDPAMSRFLITLSQAAAFVWSSLERMSGGEVFVPKMPSAHILDLAEAVAPNTDRIFVGIRPGEKLAEALIAEGEGRDVIDLGDRYALVPNHPWWDQSAWVHSPRMSAGWSYTSDNNPHWLTVEELRAMIDGDEH